MDLNTENIELIEDRANLKILGRLLLKNKFLISILQKHQKKYGKDNFKLFCKVNLTKD